MPKSATSRRGKDSLCTQKGKNLDKKKKKENDKDNHNDDDNADDPNSSNKKDSDNNEDKIIIFRCDFPSTQVKVMLARGWTQITDPRDTSWHIYWCETTDVRRILDMKLEPYQKIPHFRNHYELTRKNYLCRNLKRYKKSLTKAGKLEEASLCDSMPITFELPSEYRMFLEEYQKQLGSTWIVKPVGRSQGKGIFLFRKLKDLVDWRTKGNAIQRDDTSTETFVVQKYIDDPYLLAGRKFDLRIYVLVTSFHPLKVWLAREGFARLSSEQFDLSNIDDSRVHLTNMAIQLKAKRNDDIANTNEDHTKRRCKWALTKFREYLTARHGVSVVETLLQRIAGVIMASLLAVQPVMMQGKNSFELYGYDVLLDEDLRPWLLEVNASPALTGTDSDDHRLKFDLIDDVLNVLDFERRFTSRELRIGGLDLLWHDGPVWTTYPDSTICRETSLPPPPPPPTTSEPRKRLNIFLGARNDREKQLRRLLEVLSDSETQRIPFQDFSEKVSPTTRRNGGRHRFEPDRNEAVA